MTTLTTTDRTPVTGTELDGNAQAVPFQGA
jgi:hypothetical protein